VALSGATARLSYWAPCLSVCHMLALQGRIQDFGLEGALAGGLGTGDWGTEVPQLDPGQSHGGGLGPSPPKTGRKLRREAKKPLTKRQKQIVQTDVLRQSIHPFMFPAKTQSAGSRVREMVHNGSRFCGATSAVQSVVF